TGVPRVRRFSKIARARVVLPLPLEPKKAAWVTKALGDTVTLRGVRPRVCPRLNSVVTWRDGAGTSVFEVPGEGVGEEGPSEAEAGEGAAGVSAGALDAAWDTLGAAASAGGAIVERSFSSSKSRIPRIDARPDKGFSCSSQAPSVGS